MKNGEKDQVYKSYNKIADWYTQHRSQELFEQPYLDLIINNLNTEAEVLDLGCGTGEPIARYFSGKGFKVTGVDGSQKLIDIARSKLPDIKFLIADMRTINLNLKYDAIIAWNSYFHLPKNDQRRMFDIFENHVKPGGMLIFTSGPDEGEVWSDNGGIDLYHASLSSGEYRRLAKEHSFKVIKHAIEDKECGSATIWIMQYRG